MSLPVSTVNNTRIYNVSGVAHQTLPDWLARRHARKLKKDPTWSRRVELIQDFSFPTACQQLKLTRDERFLVGTGTYKPQFRVWDLHQKSLKFERHTVSETLSLETISDDWQLLALLQSDRTVEFHEAKGLRYTTKIPRPGRQLLFDRDTADLLICTSQDMQVLSLEAGQFKEPFLTGSEESVECCAIGPGHGLYALAVGTQVQLWDRRASAKHVATLCRDYEGSGSNGSPTALHYVSELKLAVGNETGEVSIFDLRSPTPLYTKDHMNNFPIKGITHQEPQASNGPERIISWDKKAVKAWTYEHTSDNSVHVIEPGFDINDLVVHKGLFCLAVEESKITSYLVPAIGPAPRWASYLEHLTEELEEEAKPGEEGYGASTSSSLGLYGNYKFVDRQELQKLGLEHLIGSKLLRAYMHGYFMDLRLYEQARSIANPFAYEEYLETKKREKLEQERASRIISASSSSATTSLNKKKQAKVNARMAEQETLRRDTRFKALFTDTDFAIDEESEEWRAWHPNQATSSTKTILNSKTNDGDLRKRPKQRQ